MHNVYVYSSLSSSLRCYINVSKVIRQVQTTMCMTISQFQSKPDPVQPVCGFGFSELTLYFTTRGGDLWHTQVSSADDIIVTGSVPGLNSREKHNQRESWWCQNTCFLSETVTMLQKSASRHVFIELCLWRFTSPEFWSSSSHTWMETKGRYDG